MSEFDPRFDRVPEPFFALLVGAACGWLGCLLLVVLLFPALGLSTLAGHGLLVGSCLAGWVVGGIITRVKRGL